MTNKLLCVFLLCASPALLYAHSFHFSLAEIELNKKSKNLEIALNLEINDFKRALELHQGKPVSLEKTKKLDKIILSYLQTYFIVVLPNKKQPKYIWVGKEFLIKDCWLYFEIPVGKLQGVQFANRVFFELTSHADQVNLLNFRLGKKRRTLTFIKDKASLQTIVKDNK